MGFSAIWCIYSNNIGQFLLLFECCSQRGRGKGKPIKRSHENNGTTKLVALVQLVHAGNGYASVVSNIIHSATKGNLNES